MSDDASGRLALPLLTAGQAQKEMTVNEALTRLDIAVQASVIAGGIDQPPAAPEIGQCWIVGNAPAGEWSGQAGALAGWTSGGWRFLAPVEGMAVWIEADSLTWRRAGGAWRTGELRGSRVMVDGVQVVGAQHPAIAAPNEGDVVDVQARDTLSEVLAVLRSHGLIAA